MNILTALVLSIVLFATTARKNHLFSKVEHILSDKLNTNQENDYVKIISTKRMMNNQTKEKNNKDKEYVNRCLEDDPRFVEEIYIETLLNNLRRQEGASDMNELFYNWDFAKVASKWAKKCGKKRAHPKLNELQYDLIAHSHYKSDLPEANFTKAILNWYDEKYDYDYDSNTCAPGKECLQYKWIVSSKSLNVGCGFSICTKQTDTGLEPFGYHLCIYGADKQYTGVKPFLKGPPCSKCPDSYRCNLGLCRKPGMIVSVPICKSSVI